MRRDVFMVNDDVTPVSGSIDLLRDICDADHSIGVLSPQFEGRVGNRLQERVTKLDGLTESTQRLCFTGVYIPRRTIEAVGLLDEQFDGYGRDDDDYCRRVRMAGLKLAVTPDVVLRHGFGAEQHSASFKRTPRYPKSGIDPEMSKRYFEKWGDLK